MGIRPTCPADHLTVLGLVELAFNGSDEARVVAQLYRSGHVELDLVAELDAQIVGHMLLTPLAVEGLRALTLGPLCVHPFARGRGIGTALVRQGIAWAQAAAWQAIFVVGDPYYYGRFGFDDRRAAGFHGVYNGGFLQVLELDQGVLARSGRELCFSDAFARLG
jgi:putative acetyltransferase